jgi:pilus assembly protein CpaB
VRLFSLRIPDRLRTRQAWVLLAALGLGISAAALSHSEQTRQKILLKDQLIQSERLIEVVVAGRALPRNRLIQEEDLAVRLLPQQWLHAEQVTVDNVDRVIGSRLSRDIAAGTPLSASDISLQEFTSATIAVRPGYRLLSLPVDEASSVSGLIRPGHWIDLWAATALPPAVDLAALGTDIQVLQASVEPSAANDAVVSAVRVVAVGGETRVDRDPASAEGPVRYSSLTIEVPANKVAALLAAQSRGRLVALIRADVTPVKGTKGPIRTATDTKRAATPRVEVIVHSQGGQS